MAVAPQRLIPGDKDSTREQCRDRDILYASRSGRAAIGREGGNLLDGAIVGGGPGGLYASCLLAKRGFRVAVLEEHPVSGLPVHCTGILAREAFDEFSLPRETILNELREVRFFSPRGQTI